MLRGMVSCTGDTGWLLSLGDRWDAPSKVTTSNSLSWVRHIQLPRAEGCCTTSHEHLEGWGRLW